MKIRNNLILNNNKIYLEEMLFFVEISSTKFYKLNLNLKNKIKNCLFFNKECLNKKNKEIFKIKILMVFQKYKTYLNNIPINRKKMYRQKYNKKTKI
jgi:hypothetical protein